MSRTDEPLFDQEPPDRLAESSPTAVRARVQRLVGEQPYAVLCLQGLEDGHQPYGAIVAFAFSSDLRHAVFATPVATRKYRLLSECPSIALVIDNRASVVGDLMEIEAVTVTGHARKIDRGGDFDCWAELLVGRHEYLRWFVEAPSCALFRVDVVRFLHVERFQEVRQWVPPSDS